MEPGSEAIAAHQLRVTAARAPLAQAEALVKATQGARETEELREVPRAGLVPAWATFNSSLEPVAMAGAGNALARLV